MTTRVIPVLSVLDVDWITFDCYGTLVDWESGMRQFFSRLLVAKRISVPAEEVLKAWEPIQFRMIQQPYRRYREILAASLEEALRHVKVGYDAEDGRRFASAIGAWRPFKDVGPALKRLKAKYKLGVLSNIDRDMISRTLTYLGAPIDLVLTAEDVRAYKPSTKPFEEALKRINVPAERVLHAAFGYRYDLRPAHETGLKLCLVRRGPVPKTLSPVPNLQVADLTALADALDA